MSELAVERIDGDHRQELVVQAKKMITSSMDIFEADDHSLMSTYNDFLLLIRFSEVHPLIMISLVKQIDKMRKGALEACNRMKPMSVLGAHAINTKAAYYTYRSTYWLDDEITKNRLFEILNRCAEEANRCFHKII